jgi:hypothetical protein
MLSSILLLLSPLVMGQKKVALLRSSTNIPLDRGRAAKEAGISFY